MIVCKDASGLPSPEQRTGVHGGNGTSGDELRRFLGLGAAPLAKTKTRQASIQDVPGVVDLGVTDDEDFGWDGSGENGI